MITPHGGTLVPCLVSQERQSSLQSNLSALPVVELNAREHSDITLLSNGALSPLTGFMRHDEYESVLERMRLPMGLPWSLPVTLSLKDSPAASMTPPFVVALRAPEGDIAGVMSVEDTYPVSATSEAQRALGTTDSAHPGVQYLESLGSTYAGGRVYAFARSTPDPFAEYNRSPAETRRLFEEKGWNTIVAFQTRNPIHRAHEYLTKCAQEICDGLLIHPLVGQTQPGDIPADVRMACYTTLIEKYYHPDHTMLSVLPAAMRYAGPREAILHAILRQNYGCSHFIVGRDHAGVGKYYGTYDAQEIFEEFEPGELAITTLNFEHAAWSKQAGGMVSGKTFPKIDGDQIFLSGTKVREMLSRGERPPIEFTRPEVADILIKSMKT
ncbi:MAG: sulfate adenylyltransferase [Candidatus Krumholzibacteriota bacterium]|nr:sulfate adenylyltransferase [Candidatus Krumholzibacteriota bacterium]